MSDEKLLQKYSRVGMKLKKLKSDRFSKGMRIGSLLLSIAIFLWVINYFLSIELNLMSIIGLIVVFFILWLVVIMALEFTVNMVRAFMGTEEKLEHQKENYLRLICERIESDNIYYKYLFASPVIKRNDYFYKEERGNIFFTVQNHEGLFEEVVVLLKDIAIKHNPENEGPAEYRIYAKQVKSGVFQDFVIGHFRELIIPSEKKIGF